MKKGSRKPRPNYFFSILSIALLLFIILIVSVSWVHSKSMMKEFKENLNLIVELDATAGEGDVQSIEKALHKMPQTISSSYQFIDKETGFEAVRKEFGDDFLSSEFPNPIPDVIQINIKEEYITPEDIKVIKSDVSAISPKITGVYFEDNFLQGSMQNLNKVGVVLLVAVFIMLAVVLTLLHSTVKLSLFSNRYLIKNMELVGAKASFIMAPFLKRSVGQGLLASFIAMLLLVGFGYYISQIFPNLLQHIDWYNMGIVFVVIVFLGVFITTSSTALIVRRYLNVKLNEMM